MIARGNGRKTCTGSQNTIPVSIGSRLPGGLDTEEEELAMKAVAIRNCPAFVDHRTGTRRVPLRERTPGPYESPKL